MDLTRDNPQECFRPSSYVSLRRLGPSMNHLLPVSVWWSTCRFMFKQQSVCKFDILEKNTLIFLPLLFSVYITQHLPIICLSNDFTLK